MCFFFSQRKNILRYFINLKIKTKFNDTYSLKYIIHTILRQYSEEKKLRSYTTHINAI